jgi:hypothetical protein
MHLWSAKESAAMTTLLRRLAISLAMIAGLLVLPAVAWADSVAEADRAALAGPWRGLWSSDTHDYDALIMLNVSADGQVAGTINWTLRKSPRPDYQNKIGLTGVEHVRGTFNPNSSLLSFDGYRLDDPNKILGTDKYRLVVSENRKTTGGITWDHGSWAGRIFLKR